MDSFLTSQEYPGSIIIHNSFNIWETLVFGLHLCATSGFGYMLFSCKGMSTYLNTQSMDLLRKVLDWVSRLKRLHYSRFQRWHKQSSNQTKFEGLVISFCRLPQGALSVIWRQGKPLETILIPLKSISERCASFIGLYFLWSAQFVIFWLHLNTLS